jgi:hypothetical protein
VGALAANWLSGSHPVRSLALQQSMDYFTCFIGKAHAMYAYMISFVWEARLSMGTSSRVGILAKLRWSYL